MDDASIEVIQLTDDVTGDAVVNRKVSLDLNGHTLTGNLTMQHEEPGTIQIGTGTINGEVSINTPNATIVNKADVTGTVLIKDVAESTFDNSGRLSELRLEDANGARIINRQPELIQQFFIDSPAQVELEGVFGTVEVLQSTFLTFTENTKLTELKAEASVALEVIKPESVVIETAPQQMQVSKLTLSDAEVLKQIRANIANLKIVLEKDLSDQAVVDHGISLIRSSSDLWSGLYKKDPRGVITQRIASEMAEVENRFYDSLPTSEKLTELANAYKPVIVGATEQTGAHIVFPEVPEGIFFYLSSDFSVTERYVLPERPEGEDEVRHVFMAYSFSDGLKHLTTEMMLHIPSGNQEITYDVKGEDEFYTLYDYVSSKDYDLDPERPFTIRVTEGKTASELLSSTLLAERQKDYEITAFRYVNENTTISPDHSFIFHKTYNAQIVSLVENLDLSEEQPNFIPVGNGGLVFDEANQTISYKGELSSVEVTHALTEYYTTNNPVEERVEFRVVNVLADDEVLKSNDALFMASERGHEGTISIQLKPVTQ